MTTSDQTSTETTRDHWWWRPGWRTGRAFYTWHITFDRATDVHRLIESCQQRLAAINGLDPIPSQWLHLTVQGIGFTDEVEAGVVDQIATAAAERCASLPAFEVSIRDLSIEPEVVRFEVKPVEPLARLRSELRAAIADVLGSDAVPEPADGFKPHLSVAYSGADGVALSDIAAALGDGEFGAASARVEAASLLALNRDQHCYQWTVHARAGLPTAS
jgi:2'-5' RNA ligase